MLNQALQAGTSRVHHVASLSRSPGYVKEKSAGERKKQRRGVASERRGWTILDDEEWFKRRNSGLFYDDALSGSRLVFATVYPMTPVTNCRCKLQQWFVLFILWSINFIFSIICIRTKIWLWRTTHPLEIPGKSNPCNLNRRQRVHRIDHNQSTYIPQNWAPQAQ